MEAPVKESMLPFLSLLRWIGASSNYCFVLCEMAGLSVVLSGPDRPARSRPDEAANGSCPPVESVAKQPENQSSAAPQGSASTPARSRHVPAAVRDRVFEWAGHRCQFTGPDGTRCTARTGLEIEHTKPFG